MNKLALLFTFWLFCVGGVFGQESKWHGVYSEEFHFIATFPSVPREIEGGIETSFGKGKAHRWRVELPGVSYEVQVAEIPDLTVKMEMKELQAFYKAACVEMGGTSLECRSQTGYNMFGEEGALSGFRTADGSVEYAMFLIGNWWYLAKVETNRSIEKQTSDDRKRFLDEFLFVYVSGNEKKLKYGMPAAESQRVKAPELR